MFSKLFKIVGLSLFTIFLLVFVTLSVVFLKPTLLLSAVNKWSDFDVAADKIQLQVLPLSVDAKGLVVKSNKQTLVQGATVQLSLDWKAYLSGQHTVWAGDFSNGFVDLRAMPEFEESKNTELQSADNNDLSAQLHTILTALNGSIDNLNIILSNQASLLISHVSTKLEGDDQQNPVVLKQNVSLDIKLKDKQESLNVSGLLSVSRQASITNVKLNLSEVDLSEMLSENNVNQQDTETQSSLDNSSTPKSLSTTEANVQTEVSKIEEAEEDLFNWTWLKSVRGMHVELSTPKISSKDGSIEALSLQLTLDKAITLDQFNAEIDWALSEQMRFKDTVSMSGLLTPLANQTNGPDAKVEFTAQSDNFKLITNGIVNLNASQGQDIKVGLTMNEFPIDENGTDVVSTTLQQYLPINLNTAAQVSAETIAGNISESNFGESKFKLNFKVDTSDYNKPKLELNLDAEKISFQSPQSSESEQAIENDDQSELKGEMDKVFSDEAIDFSFMQLADVDAKISIKELLLNELIVADIELPILLSSADSSSDNENSNKRLFDIENMTAKIGEGQVTTNFELETSDSPAQLSLSIDVNELELEALSLMPQDQLSGGNLLMDVDLTMIGDSLASLAAASNGKFFLNVSDAIVQNDSFELIGSDLILGILNKLNPFSKSDPTTDLKCAAVYVPIENGVAKLNDSIALQTSKLVIVAGGKVDLKTEDLDLKFTPTSKAGIGVNVSSMVKFIKIGGSLSDPSPEFDAGGALASGLAAGAAVSTGGVSLLATGLIDKVVKNDACGDVRKQYQAQ